MTNHLLFSAILLTASITAHSMTEEEVLRDGLDLSIGVEDYDSYIEDFGTPTKEKESETEIISMWRDPDGWFVLIFDKKTRLSKDWQFIPLGPNAELNITRRLIADENFQQ